MRINHHSSEISFTDLNVHEVADNAGIFIGRNRQINWNTSIGSLHSGFGTVSGNNNEIANNTHLVLHDHLKKSPEQVLQQIMKGKEAT
ncbi:hypothetical protein [Peribacillus frigoritolerans]|uniref:hypothetical protein n=1 Tax=Peribacillus frigoritolerans TaxID=450367 RepID=UPI001981EA83|nr:hypothetical protein [Peribacillus frigoritolerans]